MLISCYWNTKIILENIIQSFLKIPKLRSLGHAVVTLTARTTIIMTITWWHWYEDLNLSPGRDPSKVKSYLREPLNQSISN